MKIFITGGAGFIGSQVANMLIAKKHDVIIIDNLSSGFEYNVNNEAKLIKADITDFGIVEKIFTEEKPEIIYHFAAQIDVRKSVSDPLFDAKTNIMATLNLIKLSNDFKIKKFIFSSTGGAIYGDTNDRPTKENHSEWPLSPYGIAKLATDKFLNYYFEIFGLKYVSLRYGNVYGPRQNPYGEAGVVAIFLNKMLNNEQPIINGDGKQTRDYVYIEDVVKANILALENFDKVGIYNVGTSLEISVNDLFKEINKNFNYKFKEIHGSAKLGEQKTSCLSYEKIEKEMSFKPETNFSEGIKKTYEWFKKTNSK
ncbi:MAG: NAD-dependent epimerase/dehydratase family protein [Candidatus Acididesulfobacter diazotrophicus]|jgi:UDP-glucose 4-epimerase|uniref:NAD-dependent epimerase/dehydratase family protein n=1 Tax=Candidatus Acididesulfobacter diazotrophicus TaxID=2597226 RepID=A0A519BPD5_9DELT|nr:MAG: NAD-dependent epimerase/dehydratase family protein [Candidatus Acididesulfobacter diazotrophicus]